MTTNGLLAFAPLLLAALLAGVAGRILHDYARRTATKVRSLREEAAAERRAEARRLSDPALGQS